MKPLSAKTSGLQEQLLAQLSNLLMEKVMKMRVMIMVVILMNLLHLEEKRDHLQSSFAVNQQNSCLFSVWTLILRSVCPLVLNTVAKSRMANSTHVEVLADFGLLVHWGYIQKCSIDGSSTD